MNSVGKLPAQCKRISDWLLNLKGNNWAAASPVIASPGERPVVRTVVGAGRTVRAGDAYGRHRAPNIRAYQCDQGPDVRPARPDRTSSITLKNKQ